MAHDDALLIPVTEASCRFSCPIAIAAVLWIGFITVASALPEQNPINLQTLNYALVAAGIISPSRSSSGSLALTRGSLAPPRSQGKRQTSSSSKPCRCQKNRILCNKTELNMNYTYIHTRYYLHTDIMYHSEYNHRFLTAVGIKPNHCEFASVLSTFWIRHRNKEANETMGSSYYS
ncbi:hypothetical protein BC827DRAFT_240940 [Russula dissimulans]|nr:hypothetical protein BC827DRAFT_240940 [Russula dissimulans]